MTFRAGRGWGMPFIVSPNYVPQDPEWEKHYKPELQGCADCNGVAMHSNPPTFTREILTCEGVKTIQTTKPPDTPPVINREMDKQYLAGTQTVKHTRVINRSTRNSTDVEMIVVNPNDVV